MKLVVSQLINLLSKKSGACIVFLVNDSLKCTKKDKDNKFDPSR